MIGPKYMLYDVINTFPKDIYEFIKSGKDIDSNEFKYVGWREYYGNGIVEGLKFQWNNEKLSETFGEARRYPVDCHTEFAGNNIKKIKVCYCDEFVTGIEFYDYEN